MTNALNWVTCCFASSLLLCGAASSAGAPHPQGGFTRAYAHSTCAPWDGAAMSLTLQTAPVPAVAKGKLPPARYPQISVVLYSGHPPAGRWIEIGLYASHDGGGSIRQLDVPGQAQLREGRVWLNRATGDRLEGELRLQVPGHPGQEVSYPFSAPILPYIELCG